MTVTISGKAIRAVLGRTKPLKPVGLQCRGTASVRVSRERHKRESATLASTHRAEPAAVRAIISASPPAAIFPLTKASEALYCRPRKDGVSDVGRRSVVIRWQELSLHRCGQPPLEVARGP